MPQAVGTTEPAPSNYSMTAKARTEASRCAYMHNKISDTLGSGKSFWKDMRKQGLIPKTSDALHGFWPDELNARFSSISISPSEDPAESLDLLSSSYPDGFSFHQLKII